MYKIETDIEIEATAEKVWSILLDFPAYPHWNPFIRTIAGPVKPGEHLTVSVQAEGKTAMTFRPTVLVALANRELRWRGRFLVPGLFTGEHYFQIIPITPTRVRFCHGEIFTGILVPFVKSDLEQGTQAGFMAMNRALKAYAEQKHL